MSAIAVAVVGAAVVGSAIAANASDKSSKRAAEAAKWSAQTEAEATMKMFRISREDLAPYRRAGQRALGQLENIDPTGGAQKYIDEMEALEFQFDPEDEIYKWRQDQLEEQTNQFFASRGGYDSRAALNAIQEGGMALQENEVNRQYNQRYLSKFNQLSALYEMSRGVGAAEYAKYADIANMGRGAATTSSQNALQTGTNLANIQQNYSNALQQSYLMQGASQAQMWQGIGQGVSSAAGLYYGGGYNYIPSFNYNALSVSPVPTGTNYIQGI